MKKIAIPLWATQKYLDLVPRCVESIENNFIPEIEKVYFIHTDGEIENSPDNVVKIEIPNYGFPDTFYKTFEVYLKLENLVKDFDWFVSIDVDMEVRKKISYGDFFDESKKYFGVQHPCQFLNMPPHNEYPGSFDVNPLSNACVSDIIDLSVYWQGCLWGGKIPYVFDLMKTCDNWTKEDIKKGIQARFFEESYFNKWFLLHKEETHTLSPSFAFPEAYKSYCNFEEKITHLHKDNKSYGNNLWQ
jgi:hypothetical protein